MTSILRSSEARGRWLGWVGLALTGTLLAACTGGTDELQQWMDEQRQQTRPTVKPLTPPKTFQPQPYEAQAVVDPFSTQKLTVALRREATQPSSLLAAEMKRRREPLEAFPLDTMTMVGSVARDGRPMRCCGWTTCFTVPRWVTTWARTSAASPRSARPRSPCEKSSRTLRANGLNAPVPSSFRSRDDEEHRCGERCDERR